MLQYATCLPTPRVGGEETSRTNEAGRRGVLLGLTGFVLVATVYPMLAILVGFAIVAVSALGMPRLHVAVRTGSKMRFTRRFAKPTFLCMAVAALAFLLVATSTAQASTWSGGTEPLTNSNVTQLAGIEVDVTQTTFTGTVNLVSGGTGTVTSAPAFKVELVNNPLSNTPLGIDMFFYGGTTFYVSWSDAGCTNDGMWNNPASTQQADGFGNFATGTACPAGDGGITAPIYFVFTGAVPTITSNANGGYFAIHIRFSSSCSGFVSDGTVSPTSVTSDSNCTPSVQIPSVTDIVVPMTGLVAMIWFVGRRPKGKKSA